MLLFALPPELIREIVTATILVRSFRRAMRLRLVSRKHHPPLTLPVENISPGKSRLTNRVGKFRDFVDDALLVNKLLDNVIEPTQILSCCSPRYRPWRAYAQHYLSERIFRYPNPDPLCEESHLRRVAERVASLSGDGSNEAIRSLIASLVGMWCHPFHWYLPDPFYRVGYLASPGRNRSGPLALTQETLGRLTLDAVIYLGRTDLVHQLLSSDTLERKVCRSGGVLRRLDLAAYVASIEMLELLFQLDAGVISTMDGDRLKAPVSAGVISRASKEGHRHVFNYALDMSSPFTLNSPRASQYIYLVESMRETAFPEDFERVARLFDVEISESGAQRRWLNLPFPGGPWHQLRYSTRRDRTEMVRYFIQHGTRVDLEGVASLPGNPRAMSDPVLNSVAESGNLVMLDLLLDHGADPNGLDPERPPLLAAIGRGSIEMVRLLIKYGADVNGSSTPPIIAALLMESEEMFHILRVAGAVLDDSPQIGGRAMAMVRVYGLETMEALLESEGVGTDKPLHWAPSKEKIEQEGVHKFKNMNSEQVTMG